MRALILTISMIAILVAVACKPRKSDSQAAAVSDSMLERFKNSPFRKEGACAVNYIIMNGYTKEQHQKNYALLRRHLELGQGHYKAFIKDRDAQGVERGPGIKGTDVDAATPANAGYVIFSRMPVEDISVTMSNVGYFNPWYRTADIAVLTDSKGAPLERLKNIENSVISKMELMNDWFKGYGQGKKVDPRSALILAHRQAGNDLLLGAAMLASVTVADRLLAQYKAVRNNRTEGTARKNRADFATIINHLQPPSPGESDHVGQVYHFYGYASMRIIDGVLGRLVGELVTYGYEIVRSGDNPDFVDYNADRAGIDFGEAVAATLAEFPTKSEAAAAYTKLKCEDGVLQQGVTTQTGAATCEYWLRRAPNLHAALAVLPKLKSPEMVDADGGHSSVNNVQRCQELAKAELLGWRQSAKNDKTMVMPNYALYWYGHGTTRDEKAVIFFDEATGKTSVEYSEK